MHFALLVLVSSLIPSCIFAIFLSGMDKSCIIAIFLWSRRFSPYNRNRRTNRGAPRKFQKSFENGSALPPVFLLLVRGCFGRCENHRPFTTKLHRHIKPAFGCKRHYATEGWLSVCLEHPPTSYHGLRPTARKEGQYNYNSTSRGENCHDLPAYRFYHLQTPGSFQRYRPGNHERQNSAFNST